MTNVNLYVNIDRIIIARKSEPEIKKSQLDELCDVSKELGAKFNKISDKFQAKLRS